MTSDTLKVKAGDDLTLQFEFLDEDDNPIDLTGKDVAFCIKKRLKDPDSEAVYINQWSVHDDPTNGITTDNISDAVTSLWDPNEYQWQSRIINADTTINSSEVGKCIIQENLFDHA